MKILPILAQTSLKAKIDPPPTPHRSAPTHMKTRARAKYPAHGYSPPMPISRTNSINPPLNLAHITNYTSPLTNSSPSILSARFMIHPPKTVIRVVRTYIAVNTKETSVLKKIAFRLEPPSTIYNDITNLKHIHLSSNHSC